MYDNSRDNADMSNLKKNKKFKLKLLCSALSLWLIKVTASKLYSTGENNEKILQYMYNLFICT